MANKLNPKKRAKALNEKKNYLAKKVKFTKDEYTMLILLAVVKKEVPTKKAVAAKKVVVATKPLAADNEEDYGVPDIYTEEMRKATIKDVKEKRALITVTPPLVDYIRVQPSLYISPLNASDLCNYAIDKITRVTAITEFATCLPTIANLTLTYNALLVLAAIGREYMTPTQRTTKKQLTAKLKSQLADNANSCAILAAGNKPLFQLTGYGTRKTYTKHDGDTSACVAKTNNKKGAGKMGVSCIPIEFIKKYIIYYGTTPTYDATWKCKVGNSNQIISGLTHGVAYYFIMVAIGTDGEGEWMIPIMRNAPFA